MARRKFLKLSFLKLKINKQTFLNIIGFLFLGTGGISLISFTKSGRILLKINSLINYLFGIAGVLVPIILIIISLHFFTSKKLKIVKSNMTIGGLLIFIAILGITQAGILGKTIFENLQQDFSLVGALIILFITFFIGLVIFLDTSVDSFIFFLYSLIKSIFLTLQQYVFRQSFDNKIKKKEEEFITDKKLEEKKIESSISPPSFSLKSATLQKTTFKPKIEESGVQWTYPPLSLLSDVSQKEADRGDVKKNADIIEKTLDSFGIRAKVVEVNYGPTVTQYALEIVRGTKLSKITSLSNDLALALAAPTGQVRIEAPIPGRSLVGIEIPNKRPEIVTLKQMLESPLFSANPPLLFVPLGLDVAGNPQGADIAKMPHVLIAGTTGSGKSVLLNSWICTLLFRTKPDEVKMILVDPKRVELSLYNGVPHLLAEVIVEAEKIISALKWTVAEMENRYKIFSQFGARNIETYNNLPQVKKMPYIVIIIDELADLMIFAPGEAEDLITRIAQMSRATGIHLILATQRPSVDVITGLMKANIPARIAFNVASMVDSRVVLDMPGAEKLLGRGDMLFLPPDQAKPKRIQGPFISEKEVIRVVNFLREQTPEVHYTEEITSQPIIFKTGRGGTMVLQEEKDPLFNQAVEIISQFDKASASLLQRRLSIGYARAARILDQLEAEGYVGPAEGAKPREVLIKKGVNPQKLDQNN